MATCSRCSRSSSNAKRAATDESLRGVAGAGDGPVDPVADVARLERPALDRGQVHLAPEAIVGEHSEPVAGPLLALAPTGRATVGGTPGDLPRCRGRPGMAWGSHFFRRARLRQRTSRHAPKSLRVSGRSSTRRPSKVLTAAHSSRKPRGGPASLRAPPSLHRCHFVFARHGPRHRPTSTVPGMSRHDENSEATHLTRLNVTERSHAQDDTVPSHINCSQKNTTRTTNIPLPNRDLLVFTTVRSMTQAMIVS